MARKKETDDKASSSTAAEKPVKVPTSVRYVGQADVRILRGLEWNSQNDHSVTAEGMDGSTLEYLRSQPDFRVMYD